jgi:hypothetical protein
MADATPGAGTPSSNRNVMILLSYLCLLALIPLVVEKDDKEVKWHANHVLTSGAPVAPVLHIRNVPPRRSPHRRCPDRPRRPRSAGSAARARRSTAGARRDRRHPPLSGDALTVLHADGCAVPVHAHVQSLRRSLHRAVRCRPWRLDGRGARRALRPVDPGGHERSSARIVRARGHARDRRSTSPRTSGSH